MTDTPTAGQLSAARRTYTGTAADLEAILEEWDVHIVDEVDDNPERNPHVGFVPAEGTSLVNALERWRDAAVREALAGLGLKDEYGVLRYREANLGPNVMERDVAAVAVDMRAEGVFGPDKPRPGRLMRHKVTDWEEIPDGVTPDDIVPGYSQRWAAATREAEGQ